MADKYKLQITEQPTLYQLIQIVKLLLEEIDIEVEENKIKDTIKKHFKKVT